MKKSYTKKPKAQPASLPLIADPTQGGVNFMPPMTNVAPYQGPSFVKAAFPKAPSASSYKKNTSPGGFKMP